MMWQASKAAHLGIIKKVRCSQVGSPPELALEAGLLDRVAIRVAGVTRVKLGIKEGINLSTNIVLAAIVSRSLLSLHIDTNPYHQGSISLCFFMALVVYCLEQYLFHSV